ncbi:MAG: 2-oxo acid dehydrogenase subunit E2 [Spirochaetales bacterium]|nr:2-oxo acid dehydrogenase subunit E2 [Spirochaetales bacterium]
MDNTVQIREIIHISVNFNHNLVDGAPAARFLNTFRDYVEKSPGTIMSR